MPAQRAATPTFGRRQTAPQTLFPPSLDSAIERAPRKDVRLPATITADHLHGSMPCSVTNISASGALLRLSVDLSASNIRLPNNIRLHLTNDRCEVACRIVYQDGLKVGVCFVAPFSSTKPV